MLAEDEFAEGKLLATFEKHGEFLNMQLSFLSLDLETEPDPGEDREEVALLRKLSDIVSVKPSYLQQIVNASFVAGRVSGAIVSA